MKPYGLLVGDGGLGRHPETAVAFAEEETLLGHTGLVLLAFLRGIEELGRLVVLAERICFLRSLVTTARGENHD